MLALRQAAARIAPRPAQTLRTTRRYASGAAHQTPGHEGLGTGFFIAASALPFGCVVFFLSRPGEDGEAPALTRWIGSFRHWDEIWAERNTLHAQAVQQAASDRTLFLSAPRAANYELRFPEIVNSYSPRNVVAGSVINMDAVTEQYRKQHLEEEERKSKKLAAKFQAQAEGA